MDELHMVREGNHLVPIDEMSAEELARIPLRQQVLVTVRVPRNLRQHRLAWALATKISEACEWLHDREDAMAWLKIKARHVRYIHDHANGETQIIPKSIRFAALDQLGFDRIFKRMIYVTVTEIIPGLDEAALRAEIESMVGIDQGPAPEPAAAKPTRQRKPRAKPGELPAPVSIIPASEPVSAGDVPNQSGPAAPDEPPLTVQPTNSVPAPEPVTTPTVPSPPPAEPAPPPPAPAAAQAPITKDFAGWRAYALGWLAQYRADPHATDQEVMVRWNAERTMRNECGITSTERQPVSEIYLTIVEEKRKQGKPI